MELVTILSVSFNSEKTIAKTIESVLNQTYENIEYIIIDGASKDNTAQIARSYIPQFEAREGRSLKVISEPDKGMYDGLNKGANWAHGVIVGQINTDDWYEPDAVENMMKLYQETNYDVAWGSIRIIKPTGDMIKHAKIGKLWTTGGFCHPAMFTKRSVLLEFPYPLETMHDDFDFITAVHRAGKHIITKDIVISNYVFGGMSTRKNFKEVRERIHNSYGIYKKYGMSRFYWFHRAFTEIVKYLLG